MDALIAERFGMKVNINGTDCIVVESDFLAELGPVEGNGKNVVVFSGNVIPRRGDRVVLRGSEFTVTRIRRFNGKPQLTLEENNGGTAGIPAMYQTVVFSVYTTSPVVDISVSLRVRGQYTTSASVWPLVMVSRSGNNFTN